MHDAHGVDARETPCDLAEVLHGARSVQALLDGGAQVAAGEVLHRDEAAVVGECLLVDLHDVGAVDVDDEVRLLQEALQELVVLQQLRRHDLEHDDAAGGVLAREVDLGGRALTELVLDRVAAHAGGVHARSF